MKLDEAKQILNENGYLLESYYDKNIYFDMSDKINDSNAYWIIGSDEDLFDNSVDFILNTNLLGKNCKDKISKNSFELLFGSCETRTGIFEDVINENISGNMCKELNELISIEDHTWSNGRSGNDPDADWGGYVELIIDNLPDELMEKILTSFVIGQIYSLSWTVDPSKLFSKCNSIDDLKNLELVKQYIDVDELFQTISFEEICECIDVLKEFIKPLTEDLENWNGYEVKND